MNKKSTIKKAQKPERAPARRATDFDRIQFLALALNAFAEPVLDYEPYLPLHIVKLLQRSDDHSSPSSSRR
ncbi:MAG: hypothetical protein ACREB8_03860 [Pseudolabrys sp.]